MTYDEAVDYILNIPKFTKKNSLEHTRQFLRFLGNPERELKVIHVAGTNGKGDGESQGNGTPRLSSSHFF